MAAESRQERGIQIRLSDLAVPSLDDTQRTGVYANAYSVAGTVTEVVLDFMFINAAPGKLGESGGEIGETKVTHVARVIVSPTGARRLYEILDRFARPQEREESRGG